MFELSTFFQHTYAVEHAHCACGQQMPSHLPLTCTEEVHSLSSRVSTSWKMNHQRCHLSKHKALPFHLFITWGTTHFLDTTLRTSGIQSWCVLLTKGIWRILNENVQRAGKNDNHDQIPSPKTFDLLLVRAQSCRLNFFGIRTPNSAIPADVAKPTRRMMEGKSYFWALSSPRNAQIGYHNSGQAVHILDSNIIK